MECFTIVRSLKEAEERFEFEEDLAKRRFCPLIRDNCKGSLCMAWIGGNIIRDPDTDNNEVEVALPHCNSPIIEGVIEIKGMPYFGDYEDEDEDY